LIDCDLRKGSVHQLLNLNCEPGLSEVLTKDLEWPVALCPTRLKNLFVIPRGKTPSNPSELLGSRKMRKILEKLKAESFDYVIIDTPPLLPFTDARLLGVQTEGVIVVVQAQRTKAGVVKRAKDFLGQAHNKFLGFVLTQVDHYTPDFYGYYYYYYHHKNNQ
jgi:capsular exopolysaccharide synthesis family protein